MTFVALFGYYHKIFDVIPNYIKKNHSQHKPQKPNFKKENKAKIPNFKEKLNQNYQIYCARINLEDGVTKPKRSES